MNISNRLTVLRVLLIPMMVVLMYVGNPPCRIAAFVIFCIASFTDFLDGYLARKNSLVTVFGKFLDPLADKLLVLSALTVFCEKQIIPAWFLLIILFRELSVDGLRMIVVSNGKVIAASKFGKIKTVSQILLIILLFLLNVDMFSNPFLIILGIWVLVITVFSGVDYFVKNSEIFSKTEM